MSAIAKYSAIFVEVRYVSPIVSFLGRYYLCKSGSESLLCFLCLYDHLCCWYDHLSSYRESLHFLLFPRPSGCGFVVLQDIAIHS